MNTLRSLADKINAYTNGPVSRELVEVVIDFNILMEPAFETGSESSQRLYDLRIKTWGSELAKGKMIVRRFGEQLPRNIGAMQKVFYSFTNSEKYLRERVATSVARAVLNEAWAGINGWRD